MSIDIIIGESKIDGVHGIVGGSSFSIAQIIDPISSIVEVLFPDMSEKHGIWAGFSLINLSELNREEFMIVYKISNVEFDRYCRMKDDIENVIKLKDSGDFLARSWLQYMWYLEHDKRFDGDTARDFGLSLSELT